MRSKLLFSKEIILNRNKIRIIYSIKNKQKKEREKLSIKAANPPSGVLFKIILQVILNYFARSFRI